MRVHFFRATQQLDIAGKHHQGSFYVGEDAVTSIEVLGGGVVVVDYSDGRPQIIITAPGYALGGERDPLAPLGKKPKVPPPANPTYEDAKAGGFSSARLTRETQKANGGEKK